MRVFVYEYLSSGALAGRPVAESLHREGWAMLAAVLQDCARCPDVDTITFLDPLLGYSRAPLPSNVAVLSVGLDREERLFRAEARTCDSALIIAPEFGDILAERCRWIEEENGCLLGPSAAAVRLTADKLELARHLRARGVPTPVTDSLQGAAAPGSFPLVCKPRQGAGSQATFLVRNEEELVRCGDQSASEGARGEMIVQPYVPGTAVSVAFLLGPGQRLTLPAVEQTLSSDGRFHYRGGRLPLAPALDHRARRLAERAVQTVEGLHGYVGVDLVLGEAADGSADRVMEINPRLTTSYVGLRRLARFSLMEALLAVVRETPLPAWEWGTERVRFQADGRVEILSPVNTH
jgi:predicted ATP-grasp superfamily ATP-dependent carboligase